MRSNKRTPGEPVKYAVLPCDTSSGCLFKRLRPSQGTFANGTGRTTERPRRRRRQTSSEERKTQHISFTC